MFALLLVLGCSQSSPSPEPSPDSPSPTSQSPAFRLHWLGKKKLAGEASATNFMAIWKLPESEKLESQTLDKLSTAPWRLLPTATSLSNAPVVLLRPLLDDLVQAESYLEVHNATNQPGQLVLAIRLDTARAALWQTNFPAILDSLKPIQSYNLALSRAGEWTLLSLTHGTGGRAADSGLLTEFKARIQRDGTPCPAQITNDWFVLEGDAQNLAKALRLDWKLPATFPHINIAITGDGQNVRTRGELTFPQPLLEMTDPWLVPLDLTTEPLIGLTAMRSVKPILQRIGILTSQQARNFPDQFLIWLRSGPPLQIYFASPTENATNTFWRLAPPIMDWVNSHTDGKTYGTVSVDTNNCELKWTGFSLCAPSLKAVSDARNQYLQGGFGLLSPNNLGLPTELHNHVTGATNLLFFDWEFTAQTLPQWRYLDDISRMAFDAAHASRLRGSRVTTDWMLATMTNLSHSLTELRQTRPEQLVLTRKSTLGLTAVELDILINWIALPEFPSGMSAFWRTNPVPLRPIRATNSPPTGDR